jgi:hypothetical protein
MYDKLCFVGVLTDWRFAVTRSGGSFQNHQLIETLEPLAFPFPLLCDISIVQYSNLLENPYEGC